LTFFQPASAPRHGSSIATRDAGGPDFSPELLAEGAKLQVHFDSLDADYGLLWWSFSDDQAIDMSGATNSVSAMALESEVVVTVMRNSHGVIPEGFVFYTDRKRPVDFANAIGQTTS